MAVTIKRITDANVYVDGASYLGRVPEVTLPDIKATMGNHAALGLFGKMSLPSGLDEMEATFKLNGIYSEIAKIGANPYITHDFQIRGAAETFGGTGRTATESVVCYIRGFAKTSPNGSFKQHEAVDATLGIQVQAIKLEIAGEVIYDIDILNGIWIVDGEDVLADKRAALGL
jgi:P2 family phage contractile tail tube protein